MKRTIKSKMPIFNLNLSASTSASCDGVDSPKSDEKAAQFSVSVSVSVQIRIITPIFVINEMDKIIEGLWLGGIVAEKVLIDNKFTHILSIIETPPEHLLSPAFKTKWINIEDNGKVHIEQYFDECNEFIHTGLNTGGKIYVHCQRGLSRSPSIVIAYLMRHGTSDIPMLTFDDALNYVSSKRSHICPNLGFALALRNYENKSLNCSNSGAFHALDA